MDLVFPWDDSKFEGTSVQKATIYDSLRKMGFKLNKWGSPLNSQVAGGLGRLLPGILEKKWQLICSNSVELLQSLAEAVPITFSLTTHDSSILITTDKLVEGIQAEIFSGDDGQIGWVVKQARTFGLLCWFDVAQFHSSGSRYHYKFSDLLIKRKALGYPIVFFATFVPSRGKKFDEDSVEAVFDKIRLALGDTASILIQETVNVQYLEVELRPSELINVKL